MACAATSQLLQLYTTTRVATPSHVHQQHISRPFLITTTTTRTSRDNHHFSGGLNGRHKLSPVAKFSLANDGTVTANDDDGVSLGTVKLPSNTDLQRFETLLFQWANSLCQGASIPLPIPLKVDKISGGARLAFITIGDGTTEVLVYIDCLVFPATGDSGPIFRAIRNGPLKAQSLPGESRIMRSLLQALQKSVEIART
ncbi:uncharacterized protein LOC126677075 [Mercurialis annua]|uniref:uncharacterized protein LOC126677075 n=1 Tax=Mercurialis annua TaxID=3986 RepID=UPI002160CF4E|nr:uncharacterized protein LOC126677075 [Mercurialis annua]